MRNSPIPFHLTVNQGLAEAQGLIHIKKDSLFLEFEIKDAFGGFLKSSLKEVQIPFSEIESITYKKGLWGGSVQIEGNSMRTFEEIPESEQGRCKLKIKRKHRKKAEQSISSARVALSEYKLKMLDE